MTVIRAILINDLRHVFRDKMLLFFLFTPLVLLAFVRFFVPYLAQTYPIVLVYQSYVVMFAAMQTAIFFGFVSAFLFLEEKDEQLLAVIRVLPIRSVLFLFYRLVFATLISFAGALVILYSNGLQSITHWGIIPLAAMYATVAPVICLGINIVAQNKIEGMAFFKIIDLLLILPILSFFVPAAFKYLFAVVPVFWAYHLQDAIAKGEPFVGWLLLSIAYHVVFLWGLVVMFQRKVFG